MNTSKSRYLVAATILLTLAGCSSPQKNAKTPSTATTSPFVSSSKKLEQDFSQTETDFGKLESQSKLTK